MTIYKKIVIIDVYKYYDLGAIIMEVFNQYAVFKENCFGFSDKLDSEVFTEAKVVCHPTVQNMLFMVCSEEESKTNGLNICRMADMLSMSSDMENFVTFNLQEARKIAEQQGFIYIKDILSDDAFYAEDWMINGRNDTIVVSEEYMREKGKKYAPVTPLTNKVLHYKKVSNAFLWSSSEDLKPLPLNEENIKAKLSAYAEDIVSNAPSFALGDEMSFPLFDSKVTISGNTAIFLKIQLFFEQISKVISEATVNSEIFEITEFEFVISDYITSIVSKVFAKNEIDVSKGDFLSKFLAPLKSKNPKDLQGSIEGLYSPTDDYEIDLIKLAFLDVLRYADRLSNNLQSTDADKYAENMRALEQNDYQGSAGESLKKSLIIEMLSNRPIDFVIFSYIVANYRDELDNVSAIAKFWGFDIVLGADLQSAVYDSYLTEELFDDSENFVATLDEATLIKTQLEKVNSIYHFDDFDYITQLGEYIADIDLRRRSYNGTVFEDEISVKKAIANEVELQTLCNNLSALDESEIEDLKKHINGITIDETTKSKYLLKVKIAENRLEESILEQLCLGASLLELDGLSALLKQIEALDYAESVLSPKVFEVKDYLVLAQKNELETMLSKLDGMTDAEITAMVTKMSSDRYSKSLSQEYVRKAYEYKENKVLSDINEICDGMEDFDIEKLEETKIALTAKFEDKYIADILVKIDTLVSDYAFRTLEKLFENICYADSEEIANIKTEIADGDYSDELIAPYMEKIKVREQELIDEELDTKCIRIFEMESEELSELREEISANEKGYNEELVEKYLLEIDRRECELKNSELAELCKYIFTMEQDKLEELKETLLSDKYDESLTAIYLQKVSEREDELCRLELESKFENVKELSIEQLEELRVEILAEEKFALIVDAYIEKIEKAIENIQNKEFNDKVESTEIMNTEELEAFIAEINESRETIGENKYEYAYSHYQARVLAIELEELEEIIDGIEEFDFDAVKDAIDKVNSAEYSDENKAPYLEKLDNRMEELYTQDLDKLTENYMEIDKNALNDLKYRISIYECSSEKKLPYMTNVENRITELLEQEIVAICGKIEDLTMKKSQEVITKVRTMTIDDSIKNKYLDKVEGHIAKLVEGDQLAFIDYLKQKINEYKVPTVSFLVPSISNIFYEKYGEACRQYVNIGRFEQPIYLHESAQDSGFTLTTEYFYYINKGEANKIKADDVVTFQTKKSALKTSIVVIDKNGNSVELSSAINKSNVDDTCKAMTALATFMREQHAALHMKEMLENAVMEKTMELSINKSDVDVSKIPAGEVKDESSEEIKPKFCMECGAKIPNANAKFCFECGAKLG